MKFDAKFFQVITQYLHICGECLSPVSPKDVTEQRISCKYWVSIVESDHFKNLIHGNALEIYWFLRQSKSEPVCAWDLPQ